MLYRRLAASDTTWKETHLHEDVPYRVYNLDEDIFRSWTRTSPERGMFPCSGIIHCDRLIRMRDEILARPLMSKQDLLQEGVMITEQDKLIRKSLKTQRSIKRGDCSTRSSTTHEAESSGKRSALATSKGQVDQAKVQEVHRELQIALDRKEALDAAEDSKLLVSSQHSILWNTCQNTGLSTRLRFSPLGRVSFGLSASSKLDFILNEVMD